MAMTIQQDAVNETFADFDGLIKYTIQSFIRQYGGSFEDLYEHSSLPFMEAYLSYDRSKAKFSTRLTHILRGRFLDLYKQRARQNRNVLFTDIDPERGPVDRCFPFVDFMDSLSEDAQLVVNVVFDTPWQFEPDPDTIRYLLREYLRSQLFWNRQRISESFKEIRAALKGITI